MLRTENTAQATTVGREQLNALPINFAIGAGAVRNPLSFVQLSPGASISGWNMIRVNGAPSGTFKIIFEGQDSSSGLDAGVAYSADGNPRSGMGVDAADYDGDDLFVANFNRERFSLYRNRGNINFTDEAGCTGIGTATQMYSGWGVKFFDVDHDGDEDLIVCNSHPDDQIEKLSTTVTFKEPILLFENTNGKFNLMNARAGQAFEKNWPARGLAVGDLDNDGMPDLVIANTGEAPLILRHSGIEGKYWIGLHLMPRIAGTRIRWSAGGKIRSKLLTAGGSYLSAHDPRVLLGLGEAKSAARIEVHWPAPEAHVTRLNNVAAGRDYRVTK